MSDGHSQSSAPRASTSPIDEWTLSIIVSGAAYGVIIALYPACFHVLQVPSMTVKNGTRRFLLVYTNVTFAINTACVVFDVMAVVNVVGPWCVGDPACTPDLGHPLLAGPWAHFVAFHTPNSLASSLSFVLLTWGAQGFLIWRTLVLYRTRQHFLRVGVILLCTLLTVLSLASGTLLPYSMAVIFSTPVIRFADQQLQLYWFSITFILFSSLLVNFLITGMTVARLTYQYHILRKMAPPQHDADSIYMKFVI